MPRVSGGGGRFRIEGVYEKLLTGRSRERRRLDPRLNLLDFPAADANRDLLAWLRAESVWLAQQDIAAAIAAGEPLVVPRWYFGGHSIPREDSWPSWLRDHFGGVKSVRVNADDTIEPVDVSA